MNEHISDYFTGIGAKRLSEVEVNPKKSNQHELNGVSEFKEILGEKRKKFPGTFIYIDDDSENLITEEGLLTWYDARENHPTRTEFRLYYTTNEVIKSANAQDTIIVGKTKEDDLIVIIAAKGTTSEQQVKWLFGLEEVRDKFLVKNLIRNDFELDYSGKYILSALGIEIDEEETDYLEELLAKFDNKFPKTAEFSEFARKSLQEVSPIEEPDKTLIAYLEREEKLFKTLEKHFVAKKLKTGFGANGDDVDEFIKYSLSIQNRRKSRAGHSFENHLASIFDANQIFYSKGKKTERNNKPDFLFPSVEYYHADSTDYRLLNMLGVKTTAKDRWRQVLSEADKIERKHLITLEPAISINQTTEMIEQNLQLVVPSPLFNTYKEEQKDKLVNLQDFIELVRTNQQNL